MKVVIKKGELSHIEWISGTDRKKINSMIEEHAPFKSFYTYFNMENFWLLDYPIANEHSPYGILESWNGNIFAIYDINCGYGGGGPGRTSELLQQLKIPKHDADNWRYYSGIEVHFDNAGKLLSKRLGATIECRKEHHPEILLNDLVIPSRITKTLCFVNPHLIGFDSLGAAFHYCEPVSFECYSGNKTGIYVPLTEFLSVDYRHNRKYNYYDLAKGGFVRIIGNKFDILILTEKSHINSMIQHAYYAIFMKPFYKEIQLGSLVIYSRKTIKNNFWGKLNAVKLLFEKPKTEDWYKEDVKNPPERKDEFTVW